MADYFKIWESNVDAEQRRELKKLSSEYITKYFSGQIEFGTAGARSIMGPGSAAFNIYTVRQIAFAYVKILNQKFSSNDLAKRGIVIFHDNRHNGEQFVLEAAKIFSFYKIKVWIPEKNLLKTTPYISYVIMNMHLLGGINFTASHNPKEYQGCKIYNEFGYQLLPNETAIIAKNMEFADFLFSEKYKIDKNYLEEISNNLESQYLKKVVEIVYNDNLSKKINILFSPQHGTASLIVPKVLNQLGYNVQSFKLFDGPNPDFKDIDFINPEDPRAFSKVIQEIKNGQAKYEQIFMVDPDSDRFAVASQKIDGSYKIFTGNEIATLFLNYIIEMKKNHEKSFQNYFFVTTRVSSPLNSTIAQKNGIDVKIVDTGFKWIADAIYLNKLKNKKYLFGYEEAIGFLPTDLVLDKDGIQACAMFADMSNFYLHQNLTMDIVLQKIYEKYGQYFYNSFNYLLNSNEQKAALTKKIFNIRLKMDEVCFESKDTYSTKTEPNPTFKFYFDQNKKSFMAIRFSGTEPKMKIYICLESKNLETANTVFKNLKTYFDVLASEIIK